MSDKKKYLILPHAGGSPFHTYEVLKPHVYSGSGVFPAMNEYPGLHVTLQTIWPSLLCSHWGIAPKVLLKIGHADNFNKILYINE